MRARAVPAASSTSASRWWTRGGTRPLATGVCRALARIVLVQHLVAARAAAHDAFRERAVGERELLEALGRCHALGIHLRAEHDGQARRAAAGQVLNAQVEGNSVTAISGAVGGRSTAFISGTRNCWTWNCADVNSGDESPLPGPRMITS